MLDKYYEILGVTDKTTLREIKKAFRIKAKQLHPDVNKSPNANQQFIFLLEAYEYLVNKKTGRIYEKNTVKTKRYSTYKRWQDNEAERARHRAEYYSKIDYESFFNSSYYKTLTSLDIISVHLGFFLSVGILVFLPVILTLIYGITGLLMSLAVMFITFPVTINAIRYRPPINIKDFSDAVALVAKTRTARIIFLSALNFFIIIKIGFQTLIPFISLVMGLGFTMVFAFLLTFFVMKKNAIPSSLIAFCYVPFALNLLLVINFLFSGNPTFETYSFTHRTRWYGYGAQGRAANREKLAYIDLENNKYNSFNGIRIFADFDAMKNSKKITYRFEDGLLGFKVMKTFKFD